ncbi:HlyB/MsbA family ABC transporter [Gloeobacter violaceus PCC 7421]|uniref:HlyB/MsbA family ABC transporter n=2 Tax=Gloeobacter violaceus TaxID=33072 RepID=Q7NIB9_GLOVI|nr:HlyB/MsbA family ABC transporter [Gloeobacter violaceus PCC 7421]
MAEDEPPGQMGGCRRGGQVATMEISSTRFGLSMFVRLRRVLELVWQSGPLACVGLLLLTLVGGVLPAVQLYVGKLIIDTVVAASARPDGEIFTSRALGLVGLELGLLVLSAAVQTAGSILQEVFGEKLTFQINERILHKADALELAYFEDSKFYDALQRAQREAGYRPLGLLIQSLSITQSVVSMGALVVLLARLGAFVLPVLVLASVPLLVTTVRFVRMGYLLVRARTPEARQMSYIKTLMGTDQAAKEIKLFNLGPYFIESFRNLFTKVHRETVDLALRKGAARVGSSVFNAVCYAGLYGYLIWMALRRLLTIGDLTLYAGAVLQLNNQLQSLSESGARVYQNALFIDDLFRFLDLEPRRAVAAAPRPVPERIEQGIRFENVSFRYPGSEREVLSGVSFEIRPGETVALVGENGSGKTTLVKLLTRLYEPTGGRILLEGRDLAEYEPEQLRKLVGVVFQDFVRFHATARDNIGYGRVDALTDFERIEAAAGRGGADALITGLARGYDTMLGKWFREGQELSGGQWQKIALARAYMRDAPVLVLDEPTAALDARAEHEVFSKFRELRQGKMALLISHRFSTVLTADRIVVLEGGRVGEQGTHRELAARNGRYAELFTLQAEGYRE